MPRSTRELLKQLLVMLAMLALLVGWQAMLGGREVGLWRELWRFPASTHQVSTHSWNSSFYHGHYSRVLKSESIELLLMLDLAPGGLVQMTRRLKVARDVGEHNGQGRQGLLGSVEAQRSEQSEDHGQRGGEVARLSVGSLPSSPSSE